MRAWLTCIFAVIVMLFTAGSVRAAEVIPPSPSPHYIVDDAHVLKPETLKAIDAQLGAFETETSNQIVVGIYPKMQSDDSIAAYSVRVFKAWKPGTEANKNGVLLLIFTEDRKAWITTGYGLEGALPDATAFAIVAQDMKPRFKAGDYDGGVRAGLTSIMAATKGEYHGLGQSSGNGAVKMVLVFIVIFIVFVIIASRNSGTNYSTRYGTFGSGGRRSSGGWSGGSSGSSSGWSSGSSSGGGFSGGGGSTGGGGAGGSW